VDWPEGITCIVLMLMVPVIIVLSPNMCGPALNLNATHNKVGFPGSLTEAWQRELACCFLLFCLFVSPHFCSIINSERSQVRRAEKSEERVSLSF
jgi:hypothetical protein